jgi:hypothetical protein
MKCATKWILVALLYLTLAGCGGGGGYSGSGGMTGTMGGGTSNGTLMMELTDAPACGYDHVYVTIQKIGVNQSATAGDNDAGWYDIAVTPAQRIDLLTLTNGLLTTLGQTTLPAGEYTQMRLVLASNGSTAPFANSLIVNGSSVELPLMTPSAQQSGLKTNIDIDINANQLADFVVDFNACQSIVANGNSGNYLLDPVLSVTPHYLSGVSGYVNPVNANASMVSLQLGGDVVKATTPDSSGKFLLQPVEPGTYDLVVTTPGNATEVIIGVTITGNTITSVTPSSNPIILSTSAVGIASGVVSSTIMPIDATVRALQALSDGHEIEVASGPVNATTGAYSYSLPLFSPMVANFMSMGALNFNPDNSATAMYTLAAASGGGVKSTGPVTLAVSAPTVTNFSFP